MTIPQLANGTSDSNDGDSKSAEDTSSSDSDDNSDKEDPSGKDGYGGVCDSGTSELCGCGDFESNGGISSRKEALYINRSIRRL